jgi:AcrR family transcriptional regulator
MIEYGGVSKRLLTKIQTESIKVKKQSAGSQSKRLEWKHMKEIKMFSARQTEILDAALNIINISGIQGFTIKSLAAAINVTEGALYKHFKSKTEIFEGLLKYFDALSSEMVAGMFDEKKTFPDRIESFFISRLKLFSEKPGLAMLMFANDLFPNESNLESLVQNTIHRHGQILGQLVQNGQQQGQIRGDLPWLHLTIMIMGSMRLLLTRWRMASFGFDLENEGKDLWKSLRIVLEQ